MKCQFYNLHRVIFSGVVSQFVTRIRLVAARSLFSRFHEPNTSPTTIDGSKTTFVSQQPIAVVWHGWPQLALVDPAAHVVMTPSHRLASLLNLLPGLIALHNHLVAARARSLAHSSDPHAFAQTFLTYMHFVEAFSSRLLPRIYADNLIQVTITFKALCLSFFLLCQNKFLTKQLIEICLIKLEQTINNER